MRAATLILAAIFAVGGATSLIAGLTGARWFFSAAASRTFTGRRHRIAARVVYSVAGVLLILAALQLFTSV
ncbi:MAG: hypothetical protein K2L63_07375 [Paramuribaculum sp.]|nr:hypothetical protein [Paramuribaculum sp.]